MQKKLFVLSVGGSLISQPDGINVAFVKNLHQFLQKRIAQGERFIIVTGGGIVCRTYQGAFKKVRTTTPEELDWMGIAATRLNAEFFRLIFNTVAYPQVMNQPDKKLAFTQKIMAVCGNKPGHSTDNDAVHIAKTYGADMVINLTNVAKVYSADPRKNKKAVAYDSLTWKDYLGIIGTKWTPGGNYPFDPIASAFAQKHKLKVVIADGSNIKNLEKILDSKPFQGTTIS